MTIDAGSGLKVSIEPFDPAKHDRTAFSCGAPRIDNFLKRTAKKHQVGGFTRVWVAVAPESPRILGYYAISGHAIEAADLPPQLTKNAPNHGFVPSAYLSTFGVESAIQGQGLGRVLLADALKRILGVSAQMGIVAIVLDVLDDGDVEAVEKRKRFYTGFGFTPFPSHPMRMFLPIKSVRGALEP